MALFDTGTYLATRGGLFISAATIIGVYAVCNVALMIYNIYFHPLSGYPGPRIRAASHIPHSYATLTGTALDCAKRLHDRYGEVVRIAPGTLSYNTPAAWKDIYGSEISAQAVFVLADTDRILGHRGAYEKDPESATNNDHGRLRRSLAHAFSEKAVREQEPIIKQYIDLLMKRLSDKCNDGKDVLDMVDWFIWTAFDLTGDLGFGESFECLRKSENHPWVSTLVNMIKVGLFFSLVPKDGIIQRLLPHVIPKSMMKKQDLLRDLVLDKVDRRLESEVNRKDFISYIVRHNDRHEDKGEGISLDELRLNALVLIIAGSETSSTLLAGATYLLLKNPEVLNKLVTEVRSTFRNEDEITFSSVSHLKYLLAVIQESLRIYPPVPSNGVPRRVPAQGDMINGKWVPGNTVVSMNQLATNYSPRNFALPTAFIPERWLDHPDARFVNDNKAAMMPFSYGPRNCIGMNLAYFEMQTILARLVWNFDLVALDSRSEGWMQQLNYLLWEKKPLWVRMRRAER